MRESAALQTSFAEGLTLNFSAERFAGRLIVVEGASCAGKSTLIAALARGCHEAVVVEWNSHPDLRPVVDTLKRRRSLTPVSHCLAGLLDHRLLLDSTVIPALREGRTVISDRYLFTSVVRDGLRGVPPEVFSTIAPMYPRPDAVVLAEVPPPERLRRYRARSGSYGWYACGRDMLPGLTAEEAFAVYTDAQNSAYRALAVSNRFVPADRAGSLLSDDLVSRSARRTTTTSEAKS